MKYKILVSQSAGWMPKPVEIELRTDIDQLNLSKSLYEVASLKGLPQLTFTVNMKESLLPDFISLGLNLVSDRLIEILRKNGVMFESFPVTMSHQKIPVHGYQLFHLLQIMPIVDIEKSGMKGLENIDRIVLLEMEEKPELSMIRDSFILSEVFVREDLIREIQQNNITGCKWMNSKDYFYHTGFKRW